MLVQENFPMSSAIHLTNKMLSGSWNLAVSCTMLEKLASGCSQNLRNRSLFNETVEVVCLFREKLADCQPGLGPKPLRMGAGSAPLLSARTTVRPQRLKRSKIQRHHSLRSATSSCGGTGRHLWTKRRPKHRHAGGEGKGGA